MSVTHINIRGKRRHDLSEDCWCHPTVTSFDHRSHQSGAAIVVDHHDGRHVSVSDDIAKGSTFVAFPRAHLRARRGVRNED